MGTIKEHDRVVLTADFAAEKLAAGDVGTVVHVYPDSRAFEVEFVSLGGDMVAVITVEPGADPGGRAARNHARAAGGLTETNPMSAVPQYPQRDAVSAQEYLRMWEAGVFAPEVRLELIEGEIVERAPIGSRHAGAVKILNRIFGRLAGDRAIVSVQDPLVVGERSVPQPDLALLRPRADTYADAHPVPADVLLVVEVADTTLAFDIGTKVPTYARFGVPEVWVVDLQERSVRVFRDPSASGYRTSFTAVGEESVAVAALPDVVIALPALFPK